MTSVHWGWTTRYFDATTILLFAFLIFFLGLVFYLRKEDKREGYPMISPGTGEREIGFPEPPPTKTYETFNQGLVTLPNHRPPRKLAAKPLFYFPGAPLQPTGDPMVDAVGPASYAQRRNEPLMDWDGKPLLKPMRHLAHEWSIASVDPDPRGMVVVGADKLVAGRVVDAWIDQTTRIIRYLEVELEGVPGDRVLTPLSGCAINGGKRRITVDAVLARQFATAPRLADPDIITAREEDKVSAYFASGYLYATPQRAEPLL